MTEIWTNNTWANWLRDNGVEDSHYALIEVVGWPARPKRILSIAKTSEQLKDKIPYNKKWQIVWWSNYKNKLNNVVGTAGSWEWNKK